MTMKYFLYTIIFVTYAAFFFPVLLRAESINVDRLIEIVQNSEKGVDVVKWRCKTNFYDIRDGQKKRAPYSVTTDAVFDFRKRLYRIIQTGTVPAVDSQGKESIMPFTKAFSFDGSIYRGWHRDESPRDHMDMGVITKDLNDCVLNRQFVESEYSAIGLSSGFPTIFRAEVGDRDRDPFTFTLSGFLKEYRTNIVSSNILESGEILIVLSFKWAVENNRWLSLTVEIQFDPSSSVVTKQRVYYTNTNPVIERTTILPNFVVNNGRKIPNSILCHDVIRYSDVISNQIVHEHEIQFESLEINPPVDAHTFQIEFPDGVYVDDYVEKKYYQAGDPVDEDKAVYDFMQIHGLTSDVQVPRQRINILNYIMVRISILMIAFAVYRIIQSRRRL